MPDDSPEVRPPTERGHPRLRALARWFPAIVLAALAGTSAVSVVRSQGPPSNADAPLPASSPTRVLSLRRTLEPLRSLAADRALEAGLDAFVATQPPDTCLHVRVGSVAYDHRPDDPQAPASLQKLLTGVAVLEAFGPDATRSTDVLAGAPPVDGVIRGDLHVRGGGDPLLATPEYMVRERNQPQVFTDVGRLADAVVGAGVRGIEGVVVGDESRYDTVRYHPAWPRRFIGQGQVGPLSALSVNDGFAHFPEVTGVFGPAPDPAAYAAEVLAQELRERGVLVGGPSRSGVAPPEAVVVASVESPPMVEVVGQMLGESDNNTAELLLKELGLHRSGEGTAPAGAAAVHAVLADAGLDMSAVHVVDGSGLATENVVTCALVAGILGHEPTAEEVEGALPVAGRSGTLAGRFAAPDVAGRLRAKTGTLNTVTALAGTVTTVVDDDARFALVANAAPSERIPLEVIAAQEDLARLLASYPELPDVAHLRPG